MAEGLFSLIIPDHIIESGIALKDQFSDLRGLSTYSTLACSTLRSYIREGKLLCFKVKGEVLFKRSKFDQWMEGYVLKENRTSIRLLMRLWMP
jgi:hypothetical protein